MAEQTSKREYNGHVRKEETHDDMLASTASQSGAGVEYSLAQPNASSEMQESMAEPELLALIVELRLRDGRVSSREKDKAGPGASGSKTETNAIDTLDLSHRKIENLPYEMVDIIKDDVVRLAVGYNSLTSLPSNFTNLSKLRYLNIRANLMTTFPTVLCSLPALEILDISRNKIRKLPSDPGRLLELRVLSISNNRLRKLPTWFYRLRHLRILKLEGNPVSWPPPHVSVMPPLDKATAIDRGGIEIPPDRDTDKEAAQLAKKKAEDRHMALWIVKLRDWIEENRDEGRGDQEELLGAVRTDIPLLSSTRPFVTSSTLETLQIDQVNESPTADKGGPSENGADAAPNKIEGSLTPGESTRSIGATFLRINNEALSDEEKDRSEEVLALPVAIPKEAQVQEASFAATKEETTSEEPVAQTQTSNEGGKVANIESSAPLKEKQEEDLLEKQTGNSLRSSLALLQVTQSYDTSAMGNASSVPPLALHGRNNSVSTVHPSTSMVSTRSGTTVRRGLIRNKKSLPDLRQSHAAIMSERREMNNLLSDYADSNHLKRSDASSARRPPLPSEQSFNEAAGPTFEGSNTANGWPSGATDASDYNSSDNKSLISAGLEAVPTFATSSGAVEVDRNSYFRRLSTLPASTISKSISIPVLQCVDATRGILYALSQMHSALKQYITFASDERMTSQLNRALDIASGSMAGLIDSLDRFDSLSRTKTATLDPVIVRAVLTSCGESVATFRRIISLVHLQLKSLQKGADVRYTRTLLLLLYGSLAEVGNSWAVMEPLFSDVVPYLRGQEASASKTNLIAASSGHTYTLPSIAEASSPITPNTARFNGATSSRPQRRRHAGSFSAHDVVQGAFMIPTAPLPMSQAYEETLGQKTQRPVALAPLHAPSRSASYQVQQGDLDGTDLQEPFSPAGAHSVNDPRLVKDRQRRPTEESRKRTLSNSSGGAASSVGGISRAHGATSGVPGSSLSAPAFALEKKGAVVDDHLVLLLVKTTSIAYSVWACINDHLNVQGIPGANSTAPTHDTGSGNQSFVTLESTPILENNSFLTSPYTPARIGRATESSSSSVTVVQQQADDTMSPTGSMGGQGPNQQLQSDIANSAISTKLRKLRDFINKLVEQTNRLESCCDLIQERSGIHSPPSSTANASFAVGSSSSADTFQQVFNESSSFIKSILSISHFIKSLSAEHSFPKSIKVNLAQLTTCARDLTLHLHFLGGPATQASIVNSPAQHRKGQ